MAKEQDPPGPSYRATPLEAVQEERTLRTLAGYRLGIPTTREHIRAAGWAKALQALKRDVRGMAYGLVTGQVIALLLTQPNASLTFLMAWALRTALGFLGVCAVLLLAARLGEAFRIERLLNDPAASLGDCYDRRLKKALKRLTGTSGELATRIASSHRSGSMRTKVDRDALVELRRQVELTAQYCRQVRDRLDALLAEHAQASADRRLLLLDDIDQACGQLELHGRALNDLGKQLRQFDALEMGLSTFIAHAKIAVQGLPRLPRIDVESEAPVERRGEDGADGEAPVPELAEKKR